MENLAMKVKIFTMIKEISKIWDRKLFLKISSKKEENYKAIILEKDKTIMELASTLEVKIFSVKIKILEMKLSNSEEENKKLGDRAEFLKSKLKNAGKI